ncbi:MAG: indole-3-glycerol phosphate synthase TrpC [Bacteroidota bacterium]
MNILDKIIAAKHLEVASRRAVQPLEQLKERPLYDQTTLSLRQSIANSTNYGIIAEFKRKSPSQSDINLAADPAVVGPGYEKAGAAGLSVLTDQDFFGAHATDIGTIREMVNLPIIRKDFMVDTYQIHEAKAMGADAILLIAACLDTALLDQLATTAKSLGLEVLCEIHDEAEIAKISPAVDIVGVNNRNLKDFSVSISQSLRIGELLPPQFLKISESGIEDAQSIIRLKQAGFGGFLIGTYFMRQPDPAAALASFIAEVRRIDNIYQDAIA